MLKNRLKKFVKVNKGFSLIVLLQIVFLATLFGNAVLRPKQVINIQPTEFIQEDYQNNVIVKEELIQFRNHDNNLNGMIKVPTKERNIKSGCYEMKIEYISDTSDEDSIENSAVTISVNPARFLKAETIILDDVSKNATTRFWVPLGLGIDDFQLEVSYNGQGTVTLYSIDIQEQIIYRYVRIVGITLAMALLDLFFCVFFAAGFNKKKSMNTVFALSGITAIASMLYFNDYLILGHDLNFHLTRIVSVAEEFSHGQFPVRMMTTMCNGYGYANSLFYCDIFLWLPAVLYNLMVPLQDCYKLYVIIINGVTVLLSYYSFSKIGGNKKDGLLGSALYTLSTYRLTNLCLRAAVGEYTAMAFLPLIVLGVYKLYDNDKITWKEWLPLAIGMSGVIMSHILTVVMLVIVLAVFCVVCFNRTFQKERIIGILKAILLTILLTAWFVVPFVEGYLCMDLQISRETMEFIQRRGIYPVQLFGVFVPATGGNINYGMQNEMPLTIGLSLTVGFVGVLYYFWRRQEWSTSETAIYSKIKAFTLLTILVMGFSLWIFPWNLLQTLLGEVIGGVLGMIQYAWRYLAIVTVLIIPTILLTLNEIEKYALKTARVFRVAIIISLILTAGFFYYQLSQGATETHIYDMSNSHMMEVMEGEYFLEKTEKEVVDTYLLNKKEVSIVSGNAIVEEYNYAEEGIVRISCQNMEQIETVVELPIIAYDHYRAFDMESGMELQIGKSAKDLIQVELPSNYQGTVNVLYDSPFYWHIAELVSLGALLVLVYFVVKNLKKEVVNE